MRRDGGWNKTHGCVEKTERIDSFTSDEASCGLMLTSFGRAIDCRRSAELGDGGQWREYIDFFSNGWAETSTVRNGYGGYRVFWLCPQCARRVRYLYLMPSGLECRKCARLNYESQQAEHGDSMYYFKAGLKLAERYGVDTSDVSGFDFPGWAPPKPRGMHQSTYDRFLVRLSRYQILYGKQLARDIAEILRRLD